MNLIDLLDEDAEADRKYHRELARNQASNPCEDDVEVMCPFVGTLPDESYKSLMTCTRAIDRQIEMAILIGL